MKIFYDKKLIKVFIFTLILIIFLLIFFYDYIPQYNDASIKYNNNKYFYKEAPRTGYYDFIGEKHKVGKTFIMFWPQDLYCLDSDIEENIIFTNIGGNNDFEHIWIKEGYEFPNEKTIIDSIQVYDEDAKEYKNLDIENCSFSDIFIYTNEIISLDTNTMLKLGIAIKLKFSTIEFLFFYSIGKNEKIYLELYDDRNDLYRTFTVKDEYINKFKIVSFE